jgi:DNA-binding response OmpR family regulator
MAHQCEAPLTALVVGSLELDEFLMERLFRQCHWRLLVAGSRMAALDQLARNEVHVVLADTSVSGWPWAMVLADLRRFQPTPPLVVTSPVADEVLWSEVLNCGGFDVLARPLDTDEVRRVMISARRHFPGQAVQQRLAQAG